MKPEASKALGSAARCGRSMQASVLKYSKNERAKSLSSVLLLTFVSGRIRLMRVRIRAPSSNWTTNTAIEHMRMGRASVLVFKSHCVLYVRRYYSLRHQRPGRYPLTRRCLLTTLAPVRFLVLHPDRPGNEYSNKNTRTHLYH